jgi:hypothetical protein
MKPAEILESLKLLDPNNKEHWNQDGQPRLSAVGEGVTRSEIQAVAPTFNRSNAELPKTEEEKLTDQEIRDALVSEVDRFKSEKEALEAELKAAYKARQEAASVIESVNKRLGELVEEERKIDPRNDTEINMDYLKSCLAERMAKAGAQDEARRMLENAGLGHFVRNATLSEADRAIAARIINKRKQNNIR